MNLKKQPQTAATGKKADDRISRMAANRLYPIVLLLVAAIVVYYNSLLNGFVFDDYAVIIENKSLADPIKSLPSLFNHSYFNIAGGEASYRPVATMSYFLIYAVAGLNPFYYHLFSVTLHLANVVLVYLLVHLILKHRFTALITGLLFACHPALTEAVDCISYNEDLLAAVFFLLAFLFCLKSRTNGLKSDRKNYVLSLIFFWLGLLAKEMAITLPAIIVLYDLSINNEAGSRPFSLQAVRITIKDRWLFYSGYAVVSLLYLFIRFFILYHPSESIKPFYGSFLERIIFLPGHIFSFIKLALFPVNLTADYVYSYPHHFFTASNLIGCMVVGGLAVLSFFIFKHSKNIFFGIWWFFITLLPVYNLIPIYNPFAERYLYIPLIGFCMVVAIVFNNLFNKRLPATTPLKVFRTVAIFGILIFYASIAFQRNLDWKDSLTLWSKTVRNSPDSSIAHGSLGWAYQDLGRLAEAIREYQTAIEIFPDNYKAHYNLGLIYDRQGTLKEAVANYKKAVAINPAFIDAQFNLGNIYHNQGLLDEAIDRYRTVAELDPADFEARNNLGVAYARQGKLDKAIAEWEKVLKMAPQNKSAADNISKAKEMMD